MDPAGIVARLRELASERGFDRVGVARLEPSPHGEAYRSWLKKGHHAGMEYLAQRVEERLDPRTILPGARSALCVALQYWPLADAEEPSGDLWPRVARYAHGRDYHNLMGKRLKRLAKTLREEFAPCQTRAYVDTGPVLERELAAKAGLGVVGKNTCLLRREGSWFLLGEILLTLELPPDEPLTDLCGRCTRCLEACPTEALSEPFHLDSSRCISYWTIEHRESVPREMRRQIGDWVFGCDICQEVCPWNIRKGPVGEETDFHLPSQRQDLDLIQLLALPRDEYRERFRGSAMQRARLEGLKRNAATAMGNRGDEKYVAPLATALAQEEHAAVRCHAAWALGRIGGEPALRALTGARETEGEAEVLAEIDQALAELAANAGAPLPTGLPGGAKRP